MTEPSCSIVRDVVGGRVWIWLKGRESIELTMDEFAALYMTVEHLARTPDALAGFMAGGVASVPDESLLDG